MSTPKTPAERDAIYLAELEERYAPLLAKYTPCCAMCWWVDEVQWPELEVWKRAFPKLAWEVVLPSGVDEVEEDS